MAEGGAWHSPFPVGAISNTIRQSSGEGTGNEQPRICDLARFANSKVGNVAGVLRLSFVVKLDPSSYLNKFGQLLLPTEAWMFGLPVLAVTLGFLELMMRERAGIERPDYFRLMPPTSN
jgi:hypothetical protein